MPFAFQPGRRRADPERPRRDRGGTHRSGRGRSIGAERAGRLDFADPRCKNRMICYIIVPAV
ncbi:hypothetical protein D0U02_16530 [Burkholderia pseudomallei]|nr:hypothetical protein EGY15_01395 [Burkholderia pseudomallei]RFS60494.1 hypothetical protein D0U05_05340 [Burkholderia pseudomallei]RFS61067.1 hypothetical protein D0U02_16530 [Burkholderia pseudomallei]RFS68640.1 hypothetical protein D0U01_09850 [Burkholderia pseudomallei]